MVPALAHGRDGRRHQQDAGVVGARRRLSAGGVRDGAADGPRRARAEARPRRAAPPQSHSGREDAVHQAAQGALRRHHRNTTAATIRPARRRCSRPRGWDDFPQRQAAGARAGPLYRHRARARHQGHRPRAVRVRAGAGRRTPAASRCSPAPPRSGRGCGTALAQICAGELGLRAQDITRGARRHRRRVARPRRASPAARP